MYTLGIETSCDETSAAVVGDGKRVLSNETASSLKFHQRYQGVVPEIASRMQLETITQITDCALKQAKVALADIDLISVTCRPGLLGSLLVGISFAKALSLSLLRPLLGIDHLEGHIYANFLNRNAKIKFPFIALVISGGHTSLFRVEDFTSFRRLGATKDDACGEAFDKVAKILCLGYPGGALIERCALKGNPRKIGFRCSGSQQGLDFSFSGIKTAVLYYCRGRKSILFQERADICASFQQAVIETLLKKTLLACRLNRLRRLLVGGGVALNARLRETFLEAAKENDLEVYFPDKEFCMDNAAMVAGLAYRLYKKGLHSDLLLNAT